MFPWDAKFSKRRADMLASMRAPHFFVFAVVSPWTLVHGCELHTHTSGARLSCSGVLLFDEALSHLSHAFTRDLMLTFLILPSLEDSELEANLSE